MRTAVLFAPAAGMAVANVCYAQPLLEAMAAELAMSRATIGMITTVTQTGYALGLLFVVPLGDLPNRRRLIGTQSLLSVLTLCAVALADRTGVAGEPGREAQSRLTAGYMLCYSIGSASGAIASTVTYAHAGWNGVCLLGAAIALAALLFWAFTRHEGEIT